MASTTTEYRWPLRPQSNRRPCSSPRTSASPRRVLLGDEGRTHVVEHEQRGLSLVVGGYASTATLGGTKEGRAHRLPDERVGDLDVLWAGLVSLSKPITVSSSDRLVNSPDGGKPHGCRRVAHSGW